MNSNIEKKSSPISTSNVSHFFSIEFLPLSLIVKRHPSQAPSIPKENHPFLELRFFQHKTTKFILDYLQNHKWKCRVNVYSYEKSFLFSDAFFVISSSAELFQPDFPTYSQDNHGNKSVQLFYDVTSLDRANRRGAAFTPNEKPEEMVASPLRILSQFAEQERQHPERFSAPVLGLSQWGKQSGNKTLDKDTTFLSIHSDQNLSLSSLREGGSRTSGFLGEDSHLSEIGHLHDVSFAGSESSDVWQRTGTAPTNNSFRHLLNSPQHHLR
uniref:Uncharacterized protein n=1 Tax=Percolomonas cosmopolitus TaxID=63605 RepID=A0A7S1PG45_9EUKA|mmetsp:Transcript_5061/g.18965  ORF Transcript_5061/g.18965 Transcript_5061/m.18965 type:complete len:269 (+) Transcript_5061:56-862(+)